MIQPLTDADQFIPPLETPQALREKCAQMQAGAPYFGLGYRKTRLDPDIYARLLAHFRNNIGRFRAECVIEEIGNAAKATIPALIFEDERFNTQLAEELRPYHEAWAGMPLTLSYCYGIRCYQRGTLLYNHVDRQPHFISSTICVDHALNSPWPLHIEDVGGQAQQVNLEPGELVFYEGTRLAHGRPYPLDGDFYAGIFVHYSPIDRATNAAGK